VRHIIGDAPEFLANYSDGLTDLSLPDQLEHFRRHDAVASFASVKPCLSYHLVSTANDGLVTAIEDIQRTSIRINGGYFIFRNDIFDYIGEGEELVQAPFQRLTAARLLRAFEYDGFWQSMDTFKDRHHLEEIFARGHAPWEVWKQGVGAGMAGALI
jgi:glucose-1-phosphate cytidylyltransferase